MSMAVDSRGRVWNIEIDERSKYPELHDVALALGSFMRFAPGHEDGQPVPSLVRIRSRPARDNASDDGPREEQEQAAGAAAVEILPPGSLQEQARPRHEHRLVRHGLALDAR